MKLHHFCYQGVHRCSQYGVLVPGIIFFFERENAVRRYVQGASLRGRPTQPATLAQEKEYIKFCEADRGPLIIL